MIQNTPQLQYHKMYLLLKYFIKNNYINRFNHKGKVIIMCDSNARTGLIDKFIKFDQDHYTPTNYIGEN